MAKNNSNSFKYIIVYPPWSNNHESEHFPMWLISCLSSGEAKIREAELRMYGDLPGCLP
jgi:hypothetical protein